MQETAGDIAGLIRQAKSYDRAAFADLYRCTVRPVHRYLSARVNSLEEAEDLTQEVFVAALAGIQSLRAEDEAGLLKWLFQIARNKMVDHLRVRYRRPTTALDDASDFEDTGPLPDEVAVANDERGELREALEQLTPEQREVVVFKYVLGYANDKTARLVGKNVNAVNQLHHRALASLHRILARTERRGSALRKLEKAT